MKVVSDLTAIVSSSLSSVLCKATIRLPSRSIHPRPASSSRLHLAGGAGTDSLFLTFRGQQGLISPPADSDVIADFVTGVDVQDLSGSNLATGVGLDGNFRVLVNGTIALSDVVHQTDGLYRAGSGAANAHDGQSGLDYLLGGAANVRLAVMAGDDFLSGGADAATFAAPTLANVGNNQN